MESHALSKPEYRSGWQWWLGAIVAIAAFAFGALGLWQYESSPEHGAHPDAHSIFYHTLQLFILHAPHLEPPLPWQLHVGRWLAAALFLAAAGKAFLKVFRDEVLLVRLWLPWRRGHVVVCGLGDLGLRLALDGRRRKKFAVAIEKQPSPATVEQARASGVLVLEGNARDPAQLRRARVGRAEFLVAACQEDHTNVAIASLAGQFAKPENRRGEPLICRLLIRDPRLRQVISDEALFPHTGPSYRVNFSDLDLEDTSARQALRRYPLDFDTIREDSDPLVHLVVIGFDQMGQSLALHAARIGHFANEVGERKKRLLITVVDKDQNAGWNSFVSRYKNLHLVCDAKFTARPASDTELVSALADLCPKHDARDALVTYAFCIEGKTREDGQKADDQANLRLGLELSKLTANRSAQVLIHQTSRAGFAALLPQEGRGAAVSGHVHGFGMEDEVFSLDVMLHESEDRLAQEIHKDFLERSGGKEVHPEWDRLPNLYKESNRQAADHIPIKLRALGYVDRPLGEGKEPIEEFNDGQMDLLARIEHARWCAERWLAGWQYGKPTVRELQISEYLVTWDELQGDQKKKDWNQIEAIPRILRSLGIGIYNEESP